MSAPASADTLVPVPGRLRDVKLIGLGGVGGVVARYLALWLSTFDEDLRLVLIDGDVYEPKNAARMFFSRAGYKAEVLFDELEPALVETRLGLGAVTEYVTPENLPRLVREGDTVVLAVDNHATRKLVSDHCATLSDVCLVSGGNDGVGPDSTGVVSRGTYANVQVFVREGGAELTPALTEFHPEIADPADKPPGDVPCTEAFISVPQLLFANVATASALLNALLLHACDALHYPELCLDIRDGVMRTVPLPSRLADARQARN